MSFCFDVKEELCKISLKNDSCKLVELYGMVLFAQTVNKDCLKLSTENVFVVNRIQDFLSELIGSFFDMNEVGVTFNAVLKGEPLDLLYGVLDINESFDISRYLVRSYNDLILFLRGAFISGGYINDPLNRYHLEIVTSNYTTAKSLLELLNTNKFMFKMVVRRSSYVLYLKDSQMIYDFLYKIGARSAAFDLMNIKIEKETNNNNNRMDNCASYNMDKALNKAVEQVSAIELIKSTVGLAALPEDLLYVAVLRQENPTKSLTELTDLCDGRLSKASLSRKLNKIVEFSRSIKE